MSGKPINNSGMQCPLRGGKTTDKTCHKCELYDRIVGINPQTGEHVDKWMCAFNRIVFMSLEFVKTQREADSNIQEWRNELQEERRNSMRILGSLPLKISANNDKPEELPDNSGGIKSLEPPKED